MNKEQTIIQRFELNTEGKDYVVGDIHGEFKELEKILHGLGFNPETDRLFSVGDLVDRGSDSHLAITWLEEPWFHVIRGNHEHMFATLNDVELEGWTQRFGGLWWYELDKAQQDLLRQRFQNLPVAFEIQTKTGTVGIVHADVPQGLTWPQFVAALENGNDRAWTCALWQRSRATRKILDGVKDIDRVYCGHTPVLDCAVVGNVYLIDTGACYGGSLSVLQL